MACRLDPRTGFRMAGEWLKYQLSSPVDIGTMNCKFPLQRRKRILIPSRGAKLQFLLRLFHLGRWKSKWTDGGPKQNCYSVFLSIFVDCPVTYPLSFS